MRGTLGIGLVLKDSHGHRRCRYRDHNVDVETPAPGENFGEQAAQQQPDRGATARDRAEDAKRLRPVGSAGESDGQQGQSRGCEQRTEGALQRPRPDEHRKGLRQAPERRCTGEADQAGDEGPLAPEQITELAAEQQQAAKGERIGRDDPLPAVGGETEVPLRRRQRDVHDRRVQHDHQLGDAEQGEDRPAVWLRSRHHAHSRRPGRVRKSAASLASGVPMPAPDCET